MSTKIPAAIFDLDGTLSSCEWRRHHVTEKPKRWKAFFDGMIHDAPVPEVCLAAERAKFVEGLAVLITTGRPAQYQRACVFWLNRHGIAFDELLMRPSHDSRQDGIVKREIYERDIEPYYDVRYAYDDRPQVIEVWRDLEIPVFECIDPGLDPDHCPLGIEELV